MDQSYMEILWEIIHHMRYWGGRGQQLLSSGCSLVEDGTYSEFLVFSVSQIKELNVLLVSLFESIPALILPRVVRHEDCSQYYCHGAGHYHGDFGRKIFGFVGITEGKWPNNIAQA